MISYILKKIKGANYKLDLSVSLLDSFIIIIDRFKMVIRGFIFKFGIKSRGILFVGKNVKITHKHKLFLGKNVTIKENSSINCLVKSNIRFGDNVTLGSNSVIEGYGVLNQIGESLTISNNVGIGSHAFIAIRGRITIGSDTIIGPGLRLHSESHNYSDAKMLIREQGTSRIGISIGSNCWIGTNVTILDGVKIGDGSIIGSNSLLNKDVGNNEIHFGIPAKFFKNRF